MEDSSLLHNPTLIPWEAALSSPQHRRRRPLRSRTYLALIGILSHCHTHTNSPQLRTQEFDGGDSQSKPVSEENGSIPCDEVNSKAVLVSFPNSKHSEDTLVKESSNGEDKEYDSGFDCNQATIPNLDHINLATDGEPNVAPANSFSNGDSLVIENETGNCAMLVVNEQDDANIVPANQMDDLGALEELVLDEEFSISDYSEALGSCFGMDMVIEQLKRVDDGKENDTVLDENIFKEAEHELQLKEMELEKLILSSGAVSPSNHQNANEEIEEGEISGEAGIADALNKDVASLGETSTKMVHAPDDYFNNEEITRNDDEDRGCRQYQFSDPLLINVVNNDCNSRTTDGEMPDRRSRNVFHDSHMEIQRSGRVAPSSDNQSPPGRVFQENAAENHMVATFEKDGDASGKERKKGPMTKERRAKKKKKDRLKRAEKNRQLGVKRLKLQPVLKPKTVSYCRHYLHGRCHEGEKCNFSHDTVPLTKSKPCGHFARNSCMKGDGCPFDHQLSKYPCKNYTENGFCSRGSDCLFSHQMPANQSLSMTPTASRPKLTPAQHVVPDKGGGSSLKVSKPEGNLSSPMNKSNIRKQTDNYDIFHQKVDAKNAKQLTERTIPRTAGRAPKGIIFLSNDSITLGVNKLNENSEERVVPRKPRGINFLSFAAPTSDDSSSKMLSKLLSNSYNETRKSLMDDTGEGIPTCSLPASSGILKVNTQMNQSATSFVRDQSEKVNGTLPQQINLSSFDKNLLDDSFINERANFHYKRGGSDLPSVNERQSASGLSANLSTSFKTSFLSNTSSSVQKAVQSTLSFAASFEPDIRVGSSLHQQGAINS